MKKIKLNEDYGPGVGDFGMCYAGWRGQSVAQKKRHSKEPEWVECREVFHEEMGKGRAFYYNSPNAANTIAFIKKIEDALGLKKEQRAKFIKTNVKNIIYVTLSDFWRTKIRSMFFTIALRASEHYRGSEKNWRAALWKTYYFKNKGSKYAAERFLRGFTKINFNGEHFGSKYGYSYTDPFYGWVDTFHSKDKNWLNKVFRKK